MDRLKAREEALVAQLPLQEGREVAFYLPAGCGPTDEAYGFLRS